MERPPGRKSLGWCKILWSTPPLILDSLVQRLPTVGTWLSLVEHSLGVRGVGSSNLPVPTNPFCCCCSRAYEHTHISVLNCGGGFGSCLTNGSEFLWEFSRSPKNGTQPENVQL